MPNRILKFSLAGGQELVRTLRAKPLRVYQVLSTKMNALLYQLSSYIASQKLSGQVLKRQSGILAASIRVIPATSQGGRIRGFVEGGGSSAFYGNFHEYGVNKSWAIIATKQRALRFMVDGKVTFAKSVVHGPLAARPFMSPSLAENQESIREQLQAALDAEIQKD